MKNFDNQESQHIKEISSISKENFIEYCNQAFELILEVKQKKMKVAHFKDADLAMRRMLGLFIDKEEYEKCSVLKSFLEENFEGNVDPIFDYRKLS